jgi:Icc-related predicted phosphoesterase
VKWKTNYANSKLMPALNSLDMVPIIEKYQPNLWVYGHTHECDNQTIGETRIISNQSSYPREFDACECEGFSESGLMAEI